MDLNNINEEGETPLKVSDCFIVSAGTLHSLRSETDLYVCAFIVLVVEFYVLIKNKTSIFFTYIEVDYLIIHIYM